MPLFNRLPPSKLRHFYLSKYIRLVNFRSLTQDASHAVRLKRTWEGPWRNSCERQIRSETCFNNQGAML